LQPFRLLKQALFNACLFRAPPTIDESCPAAASRQPAVLCSAGRPHL